METTEGLVTISIVAKLPQDKMEVVLRELEEVLVKHDVAEYEVLDDDLDKDDEPDK